MNAQDLEWRIYGLVPYNISPIQQGIQFAHALQEFNINFSSLIERKLFDSVEEKDLASGFNKWSKEDKTVIILNGGTTNKDVDGRFYGTLNQHLITLNENRVLTSEFYEPCLGDQLTAVVFLVDERVWNKKKYPDFDIEYITLNHLFKYASDAKIEDTDEYKEWEKHLGGYRNVWLREFLRQFKLA